MSRTNYFRRKFRLFADWMWLRLPKLPIVTTSVAVHDDENGTITIIFEPHGAERNNGQPAFGIASASTVPTVPAVPSLARFLFDSFDLRVLSAVIVEGSLTRKEIASALGELNESDRRPTATVHAYVKRLCNLSVLVEEDHGKLSVNSIIIKAVPELQTLADKTANGSNGF